MAVTSCTGDTRRGSAVRSSKRATSDGRSWHGSRRSAHGRRCTAEGQPATSSTTRRSVGSISGSTPLANEADLARIFPSLPPLPARVHRVRVRQRRSRRHGAVGTLERVPDPPRARAGQGRSREHVPLARGARAVARPRGDRRRVAYRLDHMPRPHDARRQAGAASRTRTTSSPPDARQARLRGSDARLARGPAAAAASRARPRACRARRATARSRSVASGRPTASRRRPQQGVGLVVAAGARAVDAHARSAA